MILSQPRPRTPLFPYTTLFRSLDAQEQQQRGLERRAGQLQQQMDDIQQRAPVFDPETEGQLERAKQGMDQASQRLKGREPGRGYSEQQGALEALRGLQQQMQQGGRGGKKLPMPMGRRSGPSQKHEKVE